MAYNDDGCCLQSLITWTATFTGQVRVSLYLYPCQANSLFTTTVYATCYQGPPPPEDCMGSNLICGSLPVNSNTTNTGSVADLNACNYGCLSSAEQQGTWYVFSPSTSGNIAFTITPSAANTDYDFAIWGPYPAGSTRSSMCTPFGAPVRCSYSSLYGTTGLNYSSVDNSEDALGDKWVNDITATAGEVYLMYISNWSINGLAFTLTWNLTNGASLDCNLVLPVELLSFEGRNDETGNVLYWTTATERNNNYFTIERSLDGIDWVLIGSVDGVGDSSTPSSYHLLDDHYQYTINYYRLGQVDIDGSRKDLGTVVIDNSKEVINVLRRVNYMGQEVDEDYRGFFIEYRERGEPVMRYQ